jgi:hypothetical protein
MGHPTIDNQTPFAFEPLFLADEELRPLLVPVIKATYVLSSAKNLALAEEQVPVNVPGEFYGDPDESNYKYEPEVAFIKPATDVVLIGHAHANRAGDTQVDVTLKLGSLEKTARVFGDRTWVKSFGIPTMSDPEPFESIPLMYERAFGGWDRSHENPEKHKFEPRNPVGTGYRHWGGAFEEGMALPNIENPRKLIGAYGDAPPPIGFGFIAPHWQPRAKLAGTYDAVWSQQRMPLLPTDFDRRHLNAASPGLTADGYLKGDESVLLLNATPSGRLSFSLPGVQSPKCRVQLRGRPDQMIETNLDTVIINTDENIVLLLWRGHLALRSGPHDVVSIVVGSRG